jgi:uncharacterized protein (TIGR03435 family)
MTASKNVKNLLRNSLPSASEKEVKSVGDRVLERLQSDPNRVPVRALPFDHVRGNSRRWIPALTMAAAISIVVLIPLVMLHRAPAVFEDAAGSRRIQFDEVVRSNDSEGSTLMLADTSRVEMRAKSELSLERADDGVRIRLGNGDIIVNAAKQHGHLYVQTKDATVSVVGTVFLVQANEEGARVAVIEGVVQVRQGVTEQTLHPGDQIRTNSSMEARPIARELEWSRSAPEHIALLQQSSTLTASRSEESRAVFDVVSIRPSAPVSPPSVVGRGGAPATSACGGPFQSGSPLKLDPSHLFANNATAFRLITLAYGRNCRTTNVAGLLSGPEWTKTEQFDIEALMPEGTPGYTEKQMNDGQAPRLQSMLQSMLVQRFNLSMHRETRDIPVFNLVVVKPGKIQLSESQTPPVPIDHSKIVLSSPRGGDLSQLKSLKPAPLQPPRGLWFFRIDPAAGKVTIAATAIQLSEFLDMFVQGEQGRLIVDKTGLDGLIDIPYQVLDVGPFDVANGPSIFPEVLSQLGLKLEPARGPVEFLVVDHIERPSEN